MEDRCQVCSGPAPVILAALRNTALGLLRFAGHPNIARAMYHHAVYSHEALALLLSLEHEKTLKKHRA